MWEIKPKLKGRKEGEGDEKAKKWEGGVRKRWHQWLTTSGSTGKPHSFQVM